MGYVIENGCISPDPESFRPLLELPLPQNSKSLNEYLGLFSSYSQWVPNLSDSITPITSCKSFPLSSEAEQAFEDLKSMIAKAAVSAIDESVPFEVETDASDVAIAATLNQKGRPAAFFSRIHQGSKLKHSAIEKEGQAIDESIRHWRQFLTGSHFALKTDQKSVCYMFNQHHEGKIKNDKIMRWRLELICYSFDIVYRPGKENVAPDTFSRARCASSAHESLYKLHDSRCHPGITRFWHFMGSRDGAVVRALASHRCSSGSILELDAICGLSLLLVLFSAPRGFSQGTPVFPSPQKPTFPNSNSIQISVDE